MKERYFIIEFKTREMRNNQWYRLREVKDKYNTAEEAIEDYLKYVKAFVKENGIDWFNKDVYRLTEKEGRKIVNRIMLKD